MWPSERASRRGFVEFVAAAVMLPAGILLLHQAGLSYLDRASGLPRFGAGAALLALAGLMAFRLVRRGEYPWVLALAAVALPLFDPTLAPYGYGFRAVVAVRDILLVGTLVLFVAHAVRRGDELERRIHLEALGWSYGAVLAVLLLHAMAADVLPPLRATWIASGMLAGWVLAWVVTSVKYQ